MTSPIDHPSRKRDEPKRTIRFDPAYREAVEAGHLTPGQAYARGKREAYARQIGSRYRLAIDVAYDVADNRTTLAEVLKKSPRVAQPTRVAPPREPIGAYPILVALGLMLALAIAGWQYRGQSAEAIPTKFSTVQRSNGTQVDADGRIVRVIGSDPDRVLESYCEGMTDRGLRPAGLMPATAEHATVRIGVIRDAAAPDTLLAIPIRHDETSGRWYSGDGLRPLVPTAAPDGARLARR